MSTEPKLGTLTQPPQCGIHNLTMYYDAPAWCWKCQQCESGREGESAPAQPTITLSQGGSTMPSGLAWLSDKTEPLLSSPQAKAVPPAAETAMTAEQFDENWLRSRHFFVTGCNKGALVTLDDALAYAAHVREAAQREIMKDYAEDVEHFSDKLETAERKLAEVERVLQAELEWLDHGEWPSHVFALFDATKVMQAALASLRAESKEG